MLLVLCFFLLLVHQHSATYLGIMAHLPIKAPATPGQCVHRPHSHSWYPLSSSRTLSRASARRMHGRWVQEHMHHEVEDRASVVAAAAAAGGLPLPNSQPSTSGGAVSQSTLGVLGNTRPIDRMRFQAQLLFNHLDQAKRGALSTSDMARYVEYCNDRFGAGKYKMDEMYTPLLTRGTDVGFEEFVDLFREQVAALTNTSFLESQLKGPEIGKLLYQCAVSSKELAKALAIFKLLDFNNDGFIPVVEYAQVQGIEKKVFEDLLEDADDNDDGFLTFENFMVSYSRDRPVFLSLAVMAAHTAAFWLVFNAPVDTLIKVVVAAILVVRPAIITNPVIKIWQIGSALAGRARATSEVMKSGGAADL